MEPSISENKHSFKKFRRLQYLNFSHMLFYILLPFISFFKHCGEIQQNFNKASQKKITISFCSTAVLQVDTFT